MNEVESAFSAASDAFEEYVRTHPQARLDLLELLNRQPGPSHWRLLDNTLGQGWMLEMKISPQPR